MNIYIIGPPTKEVLDVAGDTILVEVRINDEPKCIDIEDVKRYLRKGAVVTYNKDSAWVIKTLENTKTLYFVQDGNDVLVEYYILKAGYYEKTISLYKSYDSDVDAKRCHLRLPAEM